MKQQLRTITYMLVSTEFKQPGLSEDYAIFSKLTLQKVTQNKI